MGGGERYYLYWIAGFIFDKTESYQWAFLLAGSVSLLSGIFVWFAAPRKVRTPKRLGKRRVDLTVAKNIYKNGLKSLWNGHQIG
jgi:hypothetical protein